MTSVCLRADYSSCNDRRHLHGRPIRLIMIIQRTVSLNSVVDMLHDSHVTHVSRKQKRHTVVRYNKSIVTVCHRLNARTAAVCVGFRVLGRTERNESIIRCSCSPAVHLLVTRFYLLHSYHLWTTSNIKCSIQGAC